jgi:hypothetical protein
MVNVLPIDSATLASHITGASGHKIVIVDVRSEGEFVAGHIKGAVNIPATELDVHPDHVEKFVTDHVPAATEVVFYGLDNSVRAPKVGTLLHYFQSQPYTNNTVLLLYIVAQAIHDLIENHKEYAAPAQ